MSAMLKICAAGLLVAMPFAAMAVDASVPATDTAVDQPALSQIAVRDAATGQLRAATAAEVKALQGAGVGVLRAAAKVQPNLTKYHQSGATGVRLSDSFMSYSVVVKQPNGALTEYCFDNLDAAEAAVAAPASSPVSQSQPTE